MLIAAIALGLVLGLVAGGRLTNLASIRLERIGLFVVAVVLRLGTETLLVAEVEVVDTLRVPLYAISFLLLLNALWANRSFPGMSLAFAGVLSNATVILINGAYMPIWEPSLVAAGLTPADVGTALHTILPPPLDANFLIHLGPFADVVPLPLPPFQNVASVGDLFLTFGLAFFLFAGVVRVPPTLSPEEAATIDRRLATLARRRRFWHGTAPSAEDALTPVMAATAALDRPVILGGTSPGAAQPAAPVRSVETTAQPGVSRHHPYVRLALNGSFSALWAGQLISLFGDRLNQLALVAVVLAMTGSALASGLAFFAAMLPNLLLSPIAGTFVDRWDHKETLVVSDILRAALVLLVPIAAAVNILLIYPLIFLVTTVSVFFRPARVAILPRIVPEEDLLSANSAMWVGETIADIVGYPLAALFVTMLGSAVPLAFWFDSATYIVSALLLSAIVVRTAAPRTRDAAESAGFVAELQAGWSFLRHEAVLLANTLQGAVGQFALGISIALTPAYVLTTFSGADVSYITAYGFIETGIGIGNLLGGFVIGLVGARLRKGRMVIVGYTMWGVALVLFALTDQLGLAIGLAFGQGIANMVFIIPSQTLFQERTPAELMGRVVGFRFALVFGSMTLALAVGSVLGEVIGPGPVIAAFGAVTIVAGLAGLLVPAVRDA